MINFSSFEEIRSQLYDGALTVEKLSSQYMDEIARHQPLNAFLSVYENQIFTRSRQVDEKIKKGTAGPLAGMVIAVKDNILIKGSPATCASKILENHFALYSATVIERLESADALVIGKTNMDEFGMGSSNENSAFGPVKNPLDESRVPGGSSGGSAVAVAQGMCTTALGSDTGGSIRQPASFCGVVGIKPTYGRVSRYGLVAFASSFDQIGVLARSSRDAAHILKVMAGHDPRESTSSRVKVPDYVAGLTGDVEGIRIGIPKEYLSESVEPEIRRAISERIEFLKNAGAVVSEVSLPHADYTIAAYYILSTAEASSNLARFDGVRYGHRSQNSRDLTEMYVRSRSEGFGEEVKRRIMLGTYVLSAGYCDAYYKKAQKVRRLIQNDFLKAFSAVDCIIGPTTPTTAFQLGEKKEDPLQMYLSDVFTVSANLAGVPAVSVPAGKDSSGLPIGLQITGKHFDEQTILRISDFLERLNS